MSTVVIVGGGLAAAKTAEALRENSFDGDVVLLSAEAELPYERPPLSKDYLQGKKKLPDFTVHDADWYRDNRIDVRTGVTATGLDTAARRVTAGDTTIAYDDLVLATGSRSRHLELPGADATGVHYLRSIDDAIRLSEALGAGQRLVTVGGGWIGLEVAASARSRDVDVTVTERGELPLINALGKEVAQVFYDLHVAHGVSFHSNAEVTAIRTENGAATGVELKGGTTIDAGVVLIAAGAIPNLEIAEAGGLDIADGGVLVSAGLRSSDPHVYAVGDIANAENPILGRRVRTEHWANALNQPAVAVQNILGGDAEFDNLPYFFTDQYDLGMEYVGLSDGYSSVVFRGDVAAREFLAFWLDEDRRVLAGMQVNIWDQLDDIKKLITAKKPVDTAKLADPTVPLADLLP